MKLPKFIFNIFIRFSKNFSSLQSYLKFFWLSTVFAILLPIIVGGLFIHYDNSLLNEYSVMLDYKTSHVNKNNDVIFGVLSVILGKKSANNWQSSKARDAGAIVVFAILNHPT